MYDVSNKKERYILEMIKNNTETQRRLLQMNNSIQQYVDQMEGQLLSDLAMNDEANLYDIASDMIEASETDMMDICQAYEVVKHNLIG